MRWEPIGDEDHVAFLPLVDVEQVNEQVVDSFVFTALAAEDEEELETAAVKYAVDDGLQRVGRSEGERKAEGRQRLLE